MFYINYKTIESTTDSNAFLLDKNPLHESILSQYSCYAINKTMHGILSPVKHCKNIWNTELTVEDIETIHLYSHTLFFLEDLSILPKIEDSILERIIENIISIKTIIVIPNIGLSCKEEEIVHLKKHFSVSAIKLLRTLGEKCILIGVQGVYTQEFLSSLGIQNTQILGTPAYYEMGKNKLLSHKSSSEEASYLCSSNMLPYHNIKYAHCILEDQKDLINFLYFQKTEIPFDIENYETSMLEVVSKNNVRFFASIAEAKKYISNHTLYVGSDIYTALLSLNSGLPVIITGRDVASKELSKTFCLPYNPLFSRKQDYRKAYDEIDFTIINNCYNKMYRIYEEWLLTNKLTNCLDSPVCSNTAIIQPILEYRYLSKREEIFLENYIEKAKKIDKQSEILDKESIKIASFFENGIARRVILHFFYKVCHFIVKLIDTISK